MSEEQFSKNDPTLIDKDDSPSFLLTYFKKMKGSQNLPVYSIADNLQRKDYRDASTLELQKNLVVILMCITCECTWSWKTTIKDPFVADFGTKTNQFH